VNFAIGRNNTSQIVFAFSQKCCRKCGRTKLRMRWVIINFSHEIRVWNAMSHHFSHEIWVRIAKFEQWPRLFAARAGWNAMSHHSYYEIWVWIAKFRHWPRLFTARAAWNAMSHRFSTKSESRIWHPVSGFVWNLTPRRNLILESYHYTQGARTVGKRWATCWNLFLEWDESSHVRLFFSFSVSRIYTVLLRPIFN